MKQIYNRTTIEYLKVQLQHSIQILLTDTKPNADDTEIISRAMKYIVISHTSFEEQYYRIKEYQLIIDALQEKYQNSNTTEKMSTTQFITSMPPEVVLPF